MSDSKPALQLNVPAMPLHGRHLIEASAGTGKTYNITRLYLRLLLEKHLTVKEILVMTFTKAATEEIKGRISATLREAAGLWQNVKDSEHALSEAELETIANAMEDYMQYDDEKLNTEFLFGGLSVADRVNSIQNKIDKVFN